MQWLYIYRERDLDFCLPQRSATVCFICEEYIYIYITTAQSVFQLPKIDKENFSTFRPEALRQESMKENIGEHVSCMRTKHVIRVNQWEARLKNKLEY